MAPETFTSAGAATPRSDVYSVAALLYYLLSGSDAFEAPTLAAIISRHTQGTPRPLADVIPGGYVPPDLAALLEAWMARDGGMRPANAWDALTDLEPLAIRYPWSQRDSRAAAGELGQASTVIVHAGAVATR
jgi:serine/threonine-protein kinase